MDEKKADIADLKQKNLELLKKELDQREKTVELLRNELADKEVEHQRAESRITLLEEQVVEQRVMRLGISKEMKEGNLK